MTYSKQTTLWCDADGCGEWRRLQASNVKHATQDAREEGWTSPSWGEHYCPDCSGGRRD